MLAGIRVAVLPVATVGGRHGYTQRWLEILYAGPQIPGTRTVSDLLAGWRETAAVAEV